MLIETASAALHELGGEIPWLTQREQQVLDGLARGLSVRDLAEKLHRSPHTVNDHVKGIHVKLRVSNRVQLLAMAMGMPLSATQRDARA
jgi:DNA-binding NarL/FixJ family response regulator